MIAINLNHVYCKRLGLAVALGLAIGLAGCGSVSLSLPTGGSTSTGGSTLTGDPIADSGGTAADVADSCVQAGSPTSTTHLQMFQALNDYRTSQGVATLVYSTILETAADAHALDMYNRSFFDHTNPSGENQMDRAVAAGLCRVSTVGENLAWNQQSVAEVQTGWQNSPGHNANMISTSYRYVGMGYYNSPNGPYYVQLFCNVFLP